MSHNPSRWSDAHFDAHRQIGDPQADSVVAEIFGTGDVAAVNHLMRLLVENDDIPAAELPEALIDYLDDTLILPLWTDVRQLERASTLFDHQGPEIMLLLFTSSLPVLYAKQPGAPVLTLTRRLSDSTSFQRRIVETGQFLLDVTDSAAFTDSGRGIRTTQKVRLMHAAIRYLIQHDERWRARWNPAWGLPINQSDLAGTMLSFSVTVIDGLEKAGLRIADAEKDAYLHLWKLVGHIMGIVPEMMPENYVDAQHMMRCWQTRAYGESEAGLLLMETLLEFLHERVPGRRFDSYIACWMRICLGDDLADTLQVPPRDASGMALVNIQRFLLRLQLWLRWISPLFRRLSRLLIRQLIVGLVNIEKAGVAAEFRIPERLQAQWALPQAARKPPASQKEDRS